MTLEKARTVLKITGIITIILAVLGIILGGLMIAGGGVAATMPDVQTSEESQVGAVAIVLIGIILIISAAISLIEGIFSYLASKNNKYGTVAWVFALLGLISSALSAYSQIKESAQFSTIIGVILGILLSILILMAAAKVKEAKKAESLGGSIE